MKKILALLILIISFNLSIKAQTENNLTVNLLTNESIAEVNLDSDAMIENLKNLTDILKREFQNISEKQKIALLCSFHKIGNPTIELYSNPKIDLDKQKRIFKEMNELKYINTDIVDFSILFTINTGVSNFEVDFEGAMLPDKKAKVEYQNADLKTKVALNKAWAINEVLPVLSSLEDIVDEKFEGVLKFGQLVGQLDFTMPQKIEKIVDSNSFYWRGIMEMSQGNEIILMTKVMILVSQGNFDFAQKFVEIMSHFSDSKTLAHDYLVQLKWRLKFLFEDVNRLVEKGIIEHDKGNFEKAIQIYNSILTDYPNSAWTQYELYYSENALEIKNSKDESKSREKWDIARKKIYQCNPLYHMDVMANNAKEAFLIYRRQEINELFKSKEERLNDIYKYADIAFDLGVYDFAAQLFWYSFTYTKDQKNSLYMFLYCLEKMGVKDLKVNFKGDFEKEFSNIEKRKKHEMEENGFYKAFAK